jgi:hypothetical protein
MINISNLNAQRGKYVKKGVLEAIGVCDYSGFYFTKSDLVKQYEWRGNTLQWTGYLVGKPFLDIPNEQYRPPLIKGDPKSVENARPEEIGEDISNISADMRLNQLRGI